MRTYACAGLSAQLISTVTGSQALAGAFQLNERSTAALGASLSGSVSSARDATFAIFNPAALSTVETFETGGNFSYISPISNGTIKDGDDAGTKLDADRVGLVPSLAVGYRVNQGLVVGLTSYSPFGLKTEYSKNSPVQFEARESELTTIIVSPMLSNGVLDNLTFGASFDVLYADAKLTSNGGPIGDVNLDGDDFGYGFSVGLLFEPVKGTHIGAAYHHGYDLDINTKTFLGQSGTAEASLANWAQIGITQDITDDLRVMAQALSQLVEVRQHRHHNTGACRRAIRLAKQSPELRGRVLCLGWRRVRRYRSVHRPRWRSLGRDADHGQGPDRAGPG
jgi:long-chain fatty acid transport protein